MWRGRHVSGMGDVRRGAGNRARGYHAVAMLSKVGRRSRDGEHGRHHRAGGGLAQVRVFETLSAGETSTRFVLEQVRNTLDEFRWHVAIEQSCDVSRVDLIIRGVSENDGWKKRTWQSGERTLAN